MSMAMAIEKPSSGNEKLRRTILRYTALNDTAWIIWARSPDEMHQPLRVELNGAACDAQTGYFTVQDQTFAYAILSHPKLAASTGATLRLIKGNTLIALVEPSTLQAARSDNLHDLFARLGTAERERLFMEFTGTVAEKLSLSHSAAFCALCQRLARGINQNAFQLSRSYWLASNVMYLEGDVETLRPQGELRPLLLAPQRLERAACRYLQLSEKTYAFIIIFSHPGVAQHAQDATLTYAIGGKPVIIDNLRPAPAYGDEFMAYINSKPPYQKQSMRAVICRALIDFMPGDCRDVARDIIRKLQLFIQHPTVVCNDAANPFNLHFDAVIPIGSQGVFLSGWMRDPLRLMASINLHSALGFSYPVHEHIFRVKRPDVQKHFQGSVYGAFEEDMGFIAYAPVPPEMARRVEGIGELHAMHFVARLHGGIEYEIHPEIRYMDAPAARDYVTKIIPSTHASEAVLTECIGPAAELLQQRCMRDVSVREVYEIGEKISQPRISLSIPLYKRLDFLKVQFATMANDPAMRECELIFVLDSPWQEPEVRDFLREYAHLYKLSVKLIVMNRNSGYAAASNTGTHYAKGDYIVLMNSDVFPCGNGWTTKMADFYASQKKIGALAPKLLYEDDSLQHAGMFFAKTTVPYWINLHYYKGFPRNYAAAQQTRPVPAVTGACLMMSQDVWKDVGRLATDYVIGDFEDSDLCLKCAERGLENWYFADAELYHLERQSVPLNNSYTDTLAWRYNARRHHERWDGLITSLMNTYQES